MSLKKVAIVGFGNVGKCVKELLEVSEDFSLEAVVKRENFDFKKVDVAILTTPSRTVPEIAEKILKLGVNTVDSYDMHSNILAVKNNLDKYAKENNSVSIISAGWDPGIDSCIRAIFEYSTTSGITYTNFGPGMSMGHSTVVKRIEGVKNAISITIPKGEGIHDRMVYVELEDIVAHDCAQHIENTIKNDPYFIHDNTKVILVDDVKKYIDFGHGVNIVRKGSSGNVANQKFDFNMSINNPALTAQILISAARASFKQNPGCYTLIEIPPINFICGNKDEIIKRIV